MALPRTLLGIGASLAVGCTGVDAEVASDARGQGSTSTSGTTIPGASGADSMSSVETGHGQVTSSTDSGAASSSSAGDASSGGSGGLPVESPCDQLDALVEQLSSSPDPTQHDDEIAQFIREAQYGAHGLPLRCDDRVIFVSTSQQPTSVAGDFNGWDPDGIPMAAPVPGAPLQVAEAEITSPGGLYKLVSDGVFLADPLARRYGWDEFGEYSLVDQRQSQGHHERWPDFSEESGPLASRTVRVHVPATLEPSTPVLVMQDGQNVFNPGAFFGGWRASVTAEALAADGVIPPLLLVGVDNTQDRLDEYSHVPDDLGDGLVGGLGDEYAEFVVAGLLPFIEERYGLTLDPASTGVLGSSMGGLISLHLAQRHPEVFGFAACMSGTLAWGTFGLENETMADRYLAAPPYGVTLYLDSGGQGPCPATGVDNYCETVAFAQTLRGLGWDDEVSLFYRWAPGGTHDELAWASRFGPALQTWLPRYTR